ncbi:DegT/DnrJ/EryC1/StrS family aminotransferase [Prochlorothrix hollandica]|uniref:Erythromycin biosynthesis sensory transduction protein eryC1 n=1 Tax=Prochlorothrix hollandica PCC 9006 = CALU 1027 TaxID=317619 RepID=A0A0M2PTZ0_PROHO|nr:DegT/DnrJ/EryC1/StrS family aminotransferase [Prochlorothrix hollandica]KKI98597.1 erythromycin biosynthesis sensory transduction protein eryC1 [Prochlorothrix hollandica PCC 9006 = CALU 1027]
MHPPIPFVDLSPQHAPLTAELHEALHQVLHQGDFILGAAVQEFEQAFAHYCGVTLGRGVACGTDAIALGLRACGLQPGDEVLVPVNTFVATVLAIQQAGGKPVFVDCDRATGLMDCDQAATRMGDRTRALVPVHLYGQMVSPQALQTLTQGREVILLEDAAQAHGADREGKRAGSLGQAAAFSFYPSKNLGAAGNGGMVVTDVAAIAQGVSTLRNYGAPEKYFHTEQGVNSRLDSLQGAVLLVKLAHLDRWNRERRRLAQIYDRLLNPLASQGLQPLRNDSGAGHVYHLYVICLNHPHLTRDQIQAALAAQGIQTGIHYPLPCHLQLAFQTLGYGRGDFPQAEYLSDRILSLPLYPGLADADVERVARSLAQLWP